VCSKKKHYSFQKQKLIRETEKRLLIATVKENHSKLVNLYADIQLLEVNIRIIIVSSHGYNIGLLELCIYV